jgi:hypothetical protein
MLYCPHGLKGVDKRRGDGLLDWDKAETDHLEAA